MLALILDRIRVFNRRLNILERRLRALENPVTDQLRSIAIETIIEPVYEARPEGPYPMRGIAMDNIDRGAIVEFDMATGQVRLAKP